MPNFKTSTWVCIGLIVFILWRCSRDYTPTSSSPTATTPVYTPPTVRERVEDVLAVTAYNQRDYNGDGLANCIDAALFFKKLYPEAEIVYVKSRNNKEAHLFNRVNGVNVEPQLVDGFGKVLNQYKYDMSTATVKSVDDVYNRRW